MLSWRDLFAPACRSVSERGQFSTRWPTAKILTYQGPPRRLYVDANFASPYALVAFVSLIEKGLDFEIEALDLAANAHHDPNFARTSITLRVPTLIHDGFALSESSVICEYLDESFAGTRLYPSDLRARARARQIQAWLRSDLMPIRDERPTFVVFRGAKRPALSERARGRRHPDRRGSVPARWPHRQSLRRLVYRGH